MWQTKRAPISVYANVCHKITILVEECDENKKQIFGRRTQNHTINFLEQYEYNI